MSRLHEIPITQTWKYIIYKNIIAWLVVYDSAADQWPAKKNIFPFPTDKETAKKHKKMCCPKQHSEQ